MMSRLFVVVLLGCHLVTASSTGKKAEWTPAENIQIEQGQDLKLTCRVKDVGLLSVVRITRRKPSTTTEDVISDMDIIKPNFAISGRYNINSEQDGNDIIIHLQYTGIRGEDMGELSCFEQGKHQDAAKIMVRVLVPVEDIYWEYAGGEGPAGVRLEENSEVLLRQGKQSRLTCIVKMDGTHLSPALDVQIGGNTELGRFVREDFPRQIKPNGRAAHDSIEIKMSMDTMTPKADFHDKNLTCTAKVEGYEDQEASVRLNVEFAPIITCPKYEWFGQLGRPLTIKCDVHSNPGSSLSWWYGDDRESATEIDLSLPPKESRFIHREKAFSDSHAHVSLIIKSLNVSHLTNFYLSAKNDVDTKEVTVTVSEGVVEAIEVQHKPNNPAYSTNNKPSKRPRPRADPQRVRSTASSIISTTWSAILLSLFVSLQR